MFSKGRQTTALVPFLVRSMQGSHSYMEAFYSCSCNDLLPSLLTFRTRRPQTQAVRIDNRRVVVGFGNNRILSLHATTNWQHQTCLFSKILSSLQQMQGHLVQFLFVVVVVLYVSKSPQVLKVRGSCFSVITLAHCSLHLSSSCDK